LPRGFVPGVEERTSAFCAFFARSGSLRLNKGVEIVGRSAKMKRAIWIVMPVLAVSLGAISWAQGKLEALDQRGGGFNIGAQDWR
jgi:hypothetical protein